MRLVVVLLLVWFAGVSHAEPSLFLDPEGSARAITLKRAVVGLKEGDVWARRQGPGAFIRPKPVDIPWEGGKSDLEPKRFAAIFQSELAKAGLTQDAPEDLFSESEATDGLQVAVLIDRMHGTFDTVSDDGTERTRRYSGSIEMGVEWQIFDPKRRQVIQRIETTARGEVKELPFVGLERIVYEAFRQNARLFVTRDEVRTVILNPPDSKPLGPSSVPPILLSGAPEKSGMSVSGAAGSVVVVLTGDGHGSGFLVSNDGYILTNAHVVGSSRSVVVRWSDGFESDGEVIRSHKARDVALIKTNPHGRQPLALRRGPPTPGMNVYAVGTPLDPKLQGSLTKGIVSANRIMDGFSFIQSDVAVTHGNSGGPLLDEKSVVVGITDLGFEPDGKPANINLFIPIGDALDFLNLKVAP